MYVLGTAGHIDHGKSVLVRALTGIDPDRLDEEKVRGMTIDLGFAWFKLPSNQEVGIVDVPGHERFIKNMLAGVGGIDLALLIIAANEGIMPQTREHLAILDLLEIERGIVVMTKTDLVDEEWIELVKLDIEELIEPTHLAGAPIIPVSAMTGAGLPQLIETIDSVLSSSAERKDTGKPRLPIDRIFTISGSGTVVTGTLSGGFLNQSQEVEILPQGLKSRIRGLQTHKTRLDMAEPGNRVAINLVGVTTAQLERGNVVTTPGWLKPTNNLTVRLRTVSQLKRPLSHNATVNFFTGAAEAMAKIRLLDVDKLGAAETGWAQLYLDQPVALVKGDHFIIRSPMDTLGGGKIVESHTPRRLRRHRPEVIEDLKVKEKGSAEELLVAMIEARQPVERSVVEKSGDVPSDKVGEAIEALLDQGQLTPAGQGDQQILFTSAGWARMTRQITSALSDYHSRFPARPGMPKAELSSRVSLGKNAPVIWQKLIAEGLVNEAGALVSLSTHTVSLTPAQQSKIDAFIKALDESPYSPPADLIPEPDLLNLLLSQDKVVKVSEGVVFSQNAYRNMVDGITYHIKKEGKITLAEVRDLFRTSRRYAQALLEYLDEKKITRRIGDERIIY